MNKNCINAQNESLLLFLTAKKNVNQDYFSGVQHSAGHAFKDIKKTTDV